MTYEQCDALTFRWADFPPLSNHLPGTGGKLRTELEDFQVEELSLYVPQGSGSHAYARVEKRGLTTRDLVLALLAEGLQEKEIGVAGLKDKYAVTSQWLSVPQRHASALEALDKLEGARVLETSRHKNKLGIGHLKGNRFKLRVRETEPGAVQKAEVILEYLKKLGVPNYFGPQRFGRFGTNAVDGYKLIQGEKVPGGHRLKRFFISALQSLLFNRLLAKRIELELFDDVVLGDWAKKVDTGGVFKVETETESERAKRFEISATLPLYGKKVHVSEMRAGELETQALDYYNLRWANFTGRRGDRRLSRLPLNKVDLKPENDGYTISFDLQKGAFATSILREIMKTEVDTQSELTEDGLDGS